MLAATYLRAVSVAVSDVDRAKAFYVEKLDFTEKVDTTSDEDGMRWVELQPPGAAERLDASRAAR